ncbi:MAG: hypothetical protein H0V17_23630, partial [Deltaproteobacteria bacterium]|nr:hypothetical protein [Deltaproteobacteria bacterium]
MFRLRAHEDVHVETTDVPGVLEIRRVSAGQTRWTHRIDVVASYAERFTAPEVFALDARFGARGELHLIAHAFDAVTRRLLPPRELTFTDGPRLDRTRPGADRHALEANEFVIAGGIHWQVTDETATTFTLAGGRTIAKAEAAGPFLRLVRYRDWLIRIVQELDDHVLAVMAGPAARTLQWSTGLTEKTANIGFRWFERSELGHPPPAERLQCS